MLKIAVFGTGGVGGLFGSYLAKGGHEVHLIARGEHLAQIQKHGLKVRSPKSELVQKLHATDQPNQIGIVDLVLVCVKTWQLEEARAKMKPLVGAHTLILPLLNGIHSSEFMAEVFPASQVLRGYCTFLSSIESPGVIQTRGEESYVILGDYTNQPSVQVDRIYEELSVPEIASEIIIEKPRDVIAAQWWKFLYISSMGAIGSLVQLPVSKYRSLPRTRHLLEMAMVEVFNVGRAAGVQWQEGAVSRGMETVDEFPEGATTSMQRDFSAGRRTELEAFSGEVIRLATKFGIEVPIHQFCYDLLLPRELNSQYLKSEN